MSAMWNNNNTKRLGWMLAAVMLSGCSWFGGDDDDAESGPAELVDFEEEVELDKLWSSGIGGSQSEYLAGLRPLVKGGVVYAADGDGDVTALNAETGKREWRVELDLPLSGGVGSGGNAIFVGTRKGQVIALNAADGVQLWQTQLSSEILSPATGDGDIVVVQVHDGRVYGLDATTGEERWRYQGDKDVVLSLYGTSTPVVAKRTVIVGMAEGKVVGLESTRGNRMWEARLATPRGRTELEKLSDIDGEILLSGEIVYVTGYQGSVAALSRSTGRTLWSQKSSSYRGPAMSAGRLYVIEEDDVVRALRSNGGQQLWANEDMTLRRLTTPLAFSDHVAVADAEGYLHVLSSEDGRMIGRTKVDGSGVLVPMTTDGRVIYVQDNGGDVSAYKVIKK